MNPVVNDPETVTRFRERCTNPPLEAEVERYLRGDVSNVNTLVYWLMWEHNLLQGGFRSALTDFSQEREARKLAEARLSVSQSVNVAAAIQDEVTAAGMATAEAYRKWVYETDPTGANPRDAVETYRRALEAAGKVAQR
jgi:hypothetical protein